MRKLVLSTVAAAALAGGGLAVAHGLDTKSVKAVSATFTAAPNGTVRTSTCTGADGTYARSWGTYTGSFTNATGDTNLNGSITIDAQSIINTTVSPNVGVVTGHVRFGDGGNARFEGVYANGNVVGLLEGRAPTSHASLLGNLSAAFSATGGFTNGNLGGATIAGGAVEITDGGCTPPRPTPPPKPQTIHAENAVVTSYTTNGNSITVAGLSACSIPADQQSAVGALGLVQGTSQVNIECTLSGSAYNLTHLSIPGHKAVDEHDSRHHH